MWQFIAIVVGVAVGNLIWANIKQRIDHDRRHKYWVCPACTSGTSFKVSSNNKNVLEEIVNSHIQTFHHMDAQWVDYKYYLD